MKEEKIKSLNKEQKRNQKLKPDNDFYRGVITDIKKYENTSVKITVEYIKDGNKHNKSFNLKRPKNEDEFNVDNKFVRIVNLFGDRKNDPASLKYRDIWLKEENGVVKLDVPKKASLISKYKKK